MTIDESLVDWWYAIIGHLQSCKEDNHCQCHLSGEKIFGFIYCIDINLIISPILLSRKANSMNS